MLLMKRFVTSAVMTAVLLTLPGCWDYESISTKSPVIGMGIDMVSDSPDKFCVTIQRPLIAQAGNQSSSSTASSTTAYENLSAEGYTFEGILRKLQLRMSKEIDTTQLETIIISEHLSPKLMDSVIAQLIRLPKMNRLAYLVATPGATKDIVDLKTPSNAPLEAIQKTFLVHQQGYSVRRRLWEYWRDNTQLGIVPILPIIKALPRKDQESPFSLGGIEIYRDNEPGFALSPQDTLNFNLLTGKVREMTLDIPTGEDVVSLTNVQTRSRLRCIGKGRNLTLIDDVAMQGVLAKIVSQTPKPMPATNLINIKSDTQKYLTKQLTSTVHKLQSKRADVFGYGRIYLQHYPEQEQWLRNNWENSFHDAKVKIRVTVSIEDKGMLI